MFGSLAFLSALTVFLCAGPSFAQQIFDIYTTTWDRTSQFKYTNLATPINFVTPGSTGSADIKVDDSTVYQQIDGFGGTLTDNAASTLLSLKSRNADNYWSLLGYMFDTTDSKQAAGLSYLRVTLAASDFSPNVYSFDDTAGDTSLSKFSISGANNIISIIKDIKTVNSAIKIHLVSWSPPAWMKSSNNMKGGTINSKYYSTFANYLLKALQAYKSNGITAYSIAIQNEPQNGDTTYPTCTMSPSDEGQIGQSLRTLMNNNGFSGTKLIGYEHNWNNAGSYPTSLMASYGSAFAGVAFHCYEGTVNQQDSFHNAYPNKEIYQTECTGTIGSDYWQDIKWYMDNLFIGALEHNARTAAMWILAADGNGNPKLPGTDSCPNGCRGIVTINSDGSYGFNQEFWTMAQASKAIAPKDAGGPGGKRIGVSVSGGSGWALRVGAYVTARVNSGDWLRYSLVVLNWNDNNNGNWNPQSVDSTIEFRGMQARYTFPVGVTTLWWYAPNQGHTRRNGTGEAFETTMNVEHEGKTTRRQMRWERN